MMKERPIPFSAAMVRAILDGRKSQTRRVVKGLQWISTTAPGVEPYWRLPDNPRKGGPAGTPMGPHCAALCPYGVPGDRLWAREGWASDRCYDDRPPRDIPRAASIYFDDEIVNNWHRKRPGMFMPRWASRITLEVTGVRVERAQEISAEDAASEGVEFDAWDQALVARDYSKPDGWFQSWTNDDPGYVDIERIGIESYRTLWDSINAKRAPWSSNPWVWVIEFKRVAQAGE